MATASFSLPFSSVHCRSVVFAIITPIIFHLPPFDLLSLCPSSSKIHRGDIKQKPRFWFK
jgi:hypothetical protein